MLYEVRGFTMTFYGMLHLLDHIHFCYLLLSPPTNRLLHPKWSPSYFDVKCVYICIYPCHAGSARESKHAIFV